MELEVFKGGGEFERCRAGIRLREGCGDGCDERGRDWRRGRRLAGREARWLGQRKGT